MFFQFVFFSDFCLDKDTVIPHYFEYLMRSTNLTAEKNLQI